MRTVISNFLKNFFSKGQSDYNSSRFGSYSSDWREEIYQPPLATAGQMIEQRGSRQHEQRETTSFLPRQTEKTGKERNGRRRMKMATEAFLCQKCKSAFVIKHRHGFPVSITCDWWVIFTFILMSLHPALRCHSNFPSKKCSSYCYL